jgi:broad specificity phosphatase PhoE/CTP:molybdopterin cytidylyltransferase MocA
MTKDARAAVGIILAAGYSSRMGAFKALLDVGGKPAAARLIDTLREAGAGRVVLVTGHERERLADLIAKAGAVEAFNERFAEGMFTSVVAGLKMALEITAGQAPAFLLLPVDCPAASASAIKALLDAHRENPGRFIVPCYRGKKGHPLLIPASFASEILAHTGEGGLKAVTDRREADILRVETGDEGVVLDMDSPAGYEEIKAYFARFSPTPPAGARAGAESGAAYDPHDPQGAAKRFTGKIFLIRHGETKKHAERIFLGQTDVPLSDAGRKQAAGAARKLLDRGARVDLIHTSDLARAAETAEIIAETLRRERGAAPPVRPDARLREMHLGEWDGRFIREMEEGRPDEYARRGANILTWKRGHDGENYYDLRYRVAKWLYATLPDARELVAVAHGGVIKVILAEFSDMTPEAAWALEIPRGAVLRLDVRNGTVKPFFKNGPL